MDCVEQHEMELDRIVAHAVEFGDNLDDGELLERVMQTWERAGDFDDWLKTLVRDRVICKLRRAKSREGMPVIPGEVQGGGRRPYTDLIKAAERLRQAVHPFHAVCPQYTRDGMLVALEWAMGSDAFDMMGILEAIYDQEKRYDVVMAKLEQAGQLRAMVSLRVRRQWPKSRRRCPTYRRN